MLAPVGSPLLDAPVGSLLDLHVGSLLAPVGSPCWISLLAHVGPCWLPLLALCWILLDPVGSACSAMFGPVQSCCGFCWVDWPAGRLAACSVLFSHMQSCSVMLGSVGLVGWLAGSACSVLFGPFGPVQ